MLIFLVRGAVPLLRQIFSFFFDIMKRAFLLMRRVHH